jgi:general secretion pathway protein I
LLEVLVAFSILALSLGVLMQIFSGSLRNAETSRDQAQAVTLAQTLLATAGVEVPLVTGESSGVVGGKYHWRLRVTPFQEGNAAEASTATGLNKPMNLWEVSAEVLWGAAAGPQQRTLVLSSLRVQPRVAP